MGRPCQCVCGASDVSTYSVAPNVTSVDEGDAVTFTITTIDISDSTTLYWTLNTVAGTIDTSDFDGGAVNGSFTITSNSGTVVLTLEEDDATEGIEQFQFQVRTDSTSGAIVATSATVTINDTSTAGDDPTYSVAPDVTSVDEDETVTFTISTTNVSDSTTLYWDLNTVTGTIDTADFDGGAVSGSFTISSNAGTVALTLDEDETTEGVEEFQLQVRTGSTSGTIVATSTTVTISDTSTVGGDATLFSTGYNFFGQLGLNDNVNRDEFTQVPTVDWSSVSCGGSHTLAIKSDGKLRSCGYNNFGQLGFGDEEDRDVFEQVGSDEWSAVAGGGNHTMAIRSNTLWGCGFNGNGQLGLGDTIKRSTLIQVGSDEWSAVNCGSFHTVAIKLDGTLWSCGYNIFGQLGVNDTTDRNVFEQSRVSGFLVGTWSAVACGGEHTMAIRSDTGYENTLWGCGSNASGRLGLGDTIDRINFERNDSSPPRAAVVACGDAHTMIIDLDGKLLGCGQNNEGQLGLGDTTDRNVLTQIGTDTWTAIACGWQYTLAIKSDGTLWGCGNNDFGQLGLDNTTSYDTLQQIGTNNDWSSVSCENIFSFALTEE